MSNYFCYQDDCISPDSEDAFTPEEIQEIIGLIKESSFRSDESGSSIDDRMNEIFRGGKPEWSGFQSADGVLYVNCGGVMHVDDEEMGVVLQFEISEDMESFILSGMLINGVEQPEGLIEQFEEQFSTSDWDDEDEDEDDDEDDGWGDDAEERFWYGEDDSDYDDGEEDPGELLDDYDDPDDDCDCGCGHHHGH